GRTIHNSVLPGNRVLIPSRSGRGPDQIFQLEWGLLQGLNPFSIRARSGQPWFPHSHSLAVLIPSRSGRGPDLAFVRPVPAPHVLIPSRSGRGPDKVGSRLLGAAQSLNPFSI